jgi:hypothetical protein
MNPSTHPLAWHDLQWCLRRAPRKLLEALQRHGSQLMVAGGYIRSCVTNDPINDIDVFCGSEAFAHRVCLELVEGDASRIHRSDNAFTLRGFSTPIQFIHRWTFLSPETAILSFDFTIARAAFWFERAVADPETISNSDAPQGKWCSIADPRFYQDLAGRRLIYCQPVRNEEAGGSLLRVLKFYQRGYRIPLDSLGDVLARLMRGVRLSDVTNKGRSSEVDEGQIAKVFTGLLREVDPNIDPSHIAHLPAESEAQ